MSSKESKDSSSKSPDNKSTSRQLSKNVLSLKFMQRAKESEIRNELEQKRQQELDEFRWVLKRPTDSAVNATNHAQNITFESSFFALGMNAGRRSFTMNDGEEDQSAQKHMAANDQFFTHQRYKNMAEPQSIDSVLTKDSAEETADTSIKPLRESIGSLKKKNANAKRKANQGSLQQQNENSKRPKADQTLPFRKPPK